MVLTSLLCSSHKFKNLLWAHMQEYSGFLSTQSRGSITTVCRSGTHSSPIDLQLINAVVRAKCIKPRAQHSNINRERVGGIQGSCILIPTHLWTCLSQWIIYRTHSHSPSSTSIAALTKGGNEHCFNGCSCFSESARRASVQGGGAQMPALTVVWWGLGIFSEQGTRWPA